ncbi:MAG: GHKL domain-containing protein [Ruminococcaceae bacterium]|nr:GHKL domain-containing protein [Oscillospiraceae bacterium]
MTVCDLLTIFNYGLVLIYGVFLCIGIAAGTILPKHRLPVILLCLSLLALQGGCVCLWDVEAVRRIYPLITHLPLTLVLVLVLKSKPGTAIVSVCTAYLCCQLPRWISLAVRALTEIPLIDKLVYTLSITLIYYLLKQWFIRPAHDAITSSRQSLLLFGSLPCAYYLFDYATTVYSDALYKNSHALIEFLPTVLIVFYVLFLTAYHAQSQKRAQAELQRSIMEAALHQSGTEMENLRRAELQSAVYRHDMRHHLTLIQGYLGAGKISQAEEYIKTVQASADAAVSRRFCENETVNLLCSAFAERADRAKVNLQVDARLPVTLSISDAALCSLLSNGLENALHAAAEMKDGWIRLSCRVRQNQLLIEIVNSHTGRIVMRDGVPATDKPGHGFGCQSILAITEKADGLCSFESNGGIFTLRILLPLTK